MIRHILAILLAVPLFAQNPNTAAYPSAVATDQTLLVASNNADSPLAAAIDNMTTSVLISNYAKFVTPMAITIDGGTAISEILKCTSHVLSLYTCTRGFDGSTPFAHNFGAQVHGYIIAYPLNQLSAEVKAIENTLGPNLSNVPSGGSVPGTAGQGLISNGTGGFGTPFSYPLATGLGGTGGTGFTGLRKANGSTADSMAVPGADYALPSFGTGVLKGNGSGGFNAATYLDVVNLFGGCAGNPTYYISAGGTCAAIGGGGTITGVTAGTGLSGGGTSGTVTVNCVAGNTLQIGCLQPDGTTITVSGGGVISAVAFNAANIIGGGANYIPVQTGTTMTGFITPANNNVLVTNGSGVPHWSNVLPTGLDIQTPANLIASNVSGNAPLLTAGAADALTSATTTVNVHAAAAPTVGQILTATDGTHAAWMTPATSSDWVTQVTNKPFVDSRQYNFAAQTPGINLVIGPNNVTMTPVPVGVNGSDGQHYLYVSGGTGTAEGCPITGGSGTSGSPSGIIVLTCSHTHTGAWTVSSAQLGIKEAAVANAASVISAPVGTYTFQAPLILPTTVSLIGQGVQATIFQCAAAISPCEVIADPSGIGFGVHAGYQLLSTGSGSTIGLWLGGDPANVFAPTSWSGSYSRFNNVAINSFGTGIQPYNANFVNMTGVNVSGSHAGDVAFRVGSTAASVQPFDFYGSVLSTLPGSNAVVQDNYFTEIRSFGGQVSGLVTGAGLNWSSYGTHYEPNGAGAIADINNTGNNLLRIIGGLISMHGTGTTSFAVRVTGGSNAYVDVHDVEVQDDIPLTVTNFVQWGPSATGNLTLGPAIDIQPAGTFTNLYSISGTVPRLYVNFNFFNLVASVAAGSTTNFGLGNFPNRGITEITGATVGGSGIATISGLLYSQYGSLYTDNIQTFTAGSTIGETITTVANRIYNYYFDGTRIWIK